MSVIAQKRYFVIDSKYRISGTSTNFTFQFYDKVTITQCVKLIYSSIPNSSYLITANNNTFSVIYNGSNFQNVTLQIGNYRNDEICDQIQTSLNALFPTANFTCTFNKANMKYTITANNNFFIHIPDTSNIGDILGFNTGNSAIGTTLTSDKIINIIVPDYLLLYISALDCNNIMTSKNDCATFFIPLNSDKGIINYQYELNSFENIHFINTQKNITQTNFTLYNPDGTIYDNNNLDIVLLFQYI
jgi:hypothetical protein